MGSPLLSKWTLNLFIWFSKFFHRLFSQYHIAYVSIVTNAYSLSVVYCKPAVLVTCSCAKCATVSSTCEHTLLASLWNVLLHSSQLSHHPFNLVKSYLFFRFQFKYFFPPDIATPEVIPIMLIFWASQKLSHLLNATEISSS